MAMQWYVVHTYSGYENKAKLALEDAIRRYKVDERFGDSEHGGLPSATRSHNCQRKVSKLVMFWIPGICWYLVRLYPLVVHIVLEPHGVPQESTRLLHVDRPNIGYVQDMLLQQEKGCLQNHGS